jgi:hypothetical protein
MEARNILRTVCVKARPIARAGAEAALDALGVGLPEPPKGLDSESLAVRDALLKTARDIDRGTGDRLPDREGLAEEIAYCRWHCILFARLLAENGILMMPRADGGRTPVDLADCGRFARAFGAQDGWRLAAFLGSTIFPQIFPVNGAAYQAPFPADREAALKKLASELPRDAFVPFDTCLWALQYWRQAEKDEINRAEGKIGGRSVKAVTQLFTEPYLIAFLLDNSLGAWWAARRLTREDFMLTRVPPKKGEDGKETEAGAAFRTRTERELRAKAALPGVPLGYLRFAEPPHDSGRAFGWELAGGEFRKWPDSLSEFKSCDPCCGTGLFLIALLRMLVPMRMELEGLSREEAADTVIRQNIHGMDIDRRCAAISAMAVALAAWTLEDEPRWRPLPEIHVACSGIAPKATRTEWEALAEDDGKMRAAMGALHDHLSLAPIIGSLLDPAGIPAEVGRLNWDEVRPYLMKALELDLGRAYPAPAPKPAPAEPIRRSLF